MQSAKAGGISFHLAQRFFSLSGQKMNLPRDPNQALQSHFSVFSRPGGCGTASATPAEPFPATPTAQGGESQCEQGSGGRRVTPTGTSSAQPTGSVNDTFAKVFTHRAAGDGINSRDM